MHETYTREHAVQPDAGFDASSLKGKSVVVTGGGSGIGAEVTRQFVRAGATSAFVTIGDISQENGNKIISELGEDNVAFALCDVRTWSDQVELFKTAIARSPTHQIDIVFANAGISGADTVWRNDAEGQDDEPIEPDLKILNINLIGVFYTAKLATHYLSRNKEGSDRCLIMTSSLAGYLDQPGSPQYNASKWGVRGLMRSLRRTSPQYGIRVNIIAPWFIQTGIISEEVKNLLDSKGVTWAAVADAGAAVLHIASDEKMHGRALSVLPREIAPQGFADLQPTGKGYIDLERDDYSEGETFSEWQNIVVKLSHRIGTK